MTDEQYMRLALNLAEKGAGYTNPNPMVGAVIVKNDKIIGSGYHKKYGELHAERNAFASLSEPADGAILYVTLEPCCHYGKTPPCTEAILKHHIKKVVIASMDPNPLVGGKGAAILREHGIEVVTGVLEKEAIELNQPFFHFIQNKTPYVIMKYAMTADGKTATHTGASKWITGEEARNHVHKLRNRYSAIMAGIQTVLTDDPLLTCRISEGVNPIRIICDTHLRTPLTSQIVKTAKNVPTITAYCEDSTGNAAALERAGVELLKVPFSLDGRLDLPWLMQELGRKNIDSILLEGGSTLNESFLKENLVHSLLVYIAPKIFGGKDAKSPVGGVGVETPAQAYAFSFEKMTQFEEDILLTYTKKE